MKNYKKGDIITTVNYFPKLEVIEVSKSEYPNKPTYLHCKGKPNNSTYTVWLNLTVSTNGHLADWGFNMSDYDRTEVKTYEIFKDEILKRERAGASEVEARSKQEKIAALTENINSIKGEMKTRREELYHEINTLAYGAKDLKALLKDVKFTKALEEYNQLNSLLGFNFSTQFLPTI